MIEPTGRAWDKGELRNKTFEELHQLWYLCVKERNRLATEKAELKRLKMEEQLIPPMKKDLAVSWLKQKPNTGADDRSYGRQ